VLRLYDHLAGDLRSDKFQAYVLSEAVTEIVQGASAHLQMLTRDRYSLQFTDDEIVVVDHDNAGETRISDTLSGGASARWIQRPSTSSRVDRRRPPRRPTAPRLGQFFCYGHRAS
jgi:hypothetical protein